MTKTTEAKAYDIIIIGAGPAGLTAAIYASRDRLATLVLEKAGCGGLPAIVDLIENYPGFPDGISGAELMERFRKQAERFGTNIVELKEVKGIEPAGNTIKVITDQEQYDARALIVASGSVRKKLGVPGEEEFFGKGVSYCATCDGPLFRDKDIAVVGGGDAAVQEALFLTRFARKVTLIHRRLELRATKILQERLRKEPKTNLLLNHVLVSVNGDTRVRSITAKDVESGKVSEVETSGVFIYAGVQPNSKFLEGIVELDKSGHVITNERMETSVAGIYAAGDVRSKKVRQIDVACGEGAIAAISAGDYIKQLKG